MANTSARSKAGKRARPRRIALKKETLKDLAPGHNAVKGGTLVKSAYCGGVQTALCYGDRTLACPSLTACNLSRIC